jgi:hypothetical protein
MLAERARAVVVVAATAEPVLALVHSSMAAQACRRQKRLVAFRAHILALLAVRALDVLPQVLFFKVRLGAVGALEGAVVGVRAEVGSEAGGPVERLGAVGPGAGDGLEIRRKTARGRREGCGHRRRVCFRGCRVAVLGLEVVGGRRLELARELSI